jgi:hypothetical protein
MAVLLLYEPTYFAYFSAGSRGREETCVQHEPAAVGAARGRPVAGAAAAEIPPPRSSVPAAAALREQLKGDGGCCLAAAPWGAKSTHTETVYPYSEPTYGARTSALGSALAYLSLSG